MQTSYELQVKVLQALLEGKPVTCHHNGSYYRWEFAKHGMPKFDGFGYSLGEPPRVTEYFLCLRTGNMRTPAVNLGITKATVDEILVRKTSIEGQRSTYEIIQTGVDVRLPAPYAFNDDAELMFGIDVRGAIESCDLTATIARLPHERILDAEPESRTVQELWKALKTKFEKDRHLSSTCVNGMVKFAPWRRGVKSHQACFRVFIRHRGLVLVSREKLAITDMRNYHVHWTRSIPESEKTFVYTAPGLRKVTFDVHRATKGLDR